MHLGTGTIHCEQINKITTVSKISHRYPLRLMKPKSHNPNHESVYVLSYGGGMLSGDSIHLNVVVDENASLSIHSQSSTKVYKQSGIGTMASQTMHARIENNAFLSLLPEPVTCFAQACYKQRQEFHLKSTSSLFLLDWITCGRSSRGEIWEFKKFQSENIVFVNNQELLRDSWLLEALEPNELKSRMNPYQCVANVIMIGPRLSEAIKAIQDTHNKDTIYKDSKIQTVNFIWSLSPILRTQKEVGIIIRAAAIDTIIMRKFLLETFKLIPNATENFSRI